MSVATGKPLFDFPQGRRRSQRKEGRPLVAAASMEASSCNLDKNYTRKDNIHTMGSATRKSRSFSFDPQLLEEVERSKGNGSASERLNHLLMRALEAERKANLSKEAEDFFQTPAKDRRERKAFQRA